MLCFSALTQFYNAFARLEPSTPSGCCKADTLSCHFGSSHKLEPPAWGLEPLHVAESAAVLEGSLRFAKAKSAYNRLLDSADLDKRTEPAQLAVRRLTRTRKSLRLQLV